MSVESSGSMVVLQDQSRLPSFPFPSLFTFYPRFTVNTKEGLLEESHQSSPFLSSPLLLGPSADRTKSIQISFFSPFFSLFPPVLLLIFLATLPWVRPSFSYEESVKRWLCTTSFLPPLPPFPLRTMQKKK